MKPPTLAQWLNEIEKAFALVQVRADQKIGFTMYFLKNKANYWWESVRALKNVEVIIWERFIELFLEKYFSNYMQNQMELQFFELKQRNLSVIEYEARFTELA